MSIFDEIEHTKEKLSARTETLGEDDRFIDGAWLVVLAGQLGALSNNILTRSGHASRRRRLLKFAATIVSAIESLDLAEKIACVEQDMIFRHGTGHREIVYKGVTIARITENQALPATPFGLTVLPFDPAELPLYFESCAQATAHLAIEIIKKNKEKKNA